MATNMNSFKINKRGVSLIYVILVMLVMAILGVAVFTLFSSNLATAKYQQDSIRAHFLAISGVEMGYASLLVEDQGERLLDSHFKAKYLNDLTSVSSLNDVIETNEGEIEITISSYIKDGSRFIEIESTGKPNDIDTTKTIVMYFNARFPFIQHWD